MLILFTEINCLLFLDLIKFKFNIYIEIINYINLINKKILNIYFI